MTDRAFAEWVEHYDPLPREAEFDPVFPRARHYLDSCRTRTWLLYQELKRRLPQSANLLDIGLYPGTQARMCQRFFAGRARVFGAGLTLDDGFRGDMRSVIDDFREVDLDPFYAGLKSDIRIDWPDGFFDGIYALEIFEHIISPLRFIEECSRLLKPGGFLCLSTPNVSHIGGAVALLTGRSNHEAIDASPMYMPDSKWRGHIRIYSKAELVELFGRHGLTLVRHVYFNESGASLARMSWAQRAYFWSRRVIGAFVPMYREGHFMVFEKREKREKRKD